MSKHHLQSAILCRIYSVVNLFIIPHFAGILNMAGEPLSYDDGPLVWVSQY